MKRAFLVIVLAGLAFAEDAQTKAAREELERELAGLTTPAPTRVRIEYVEVADANYDLLEAEFELDGHVLKTPGAKELVAAAMPQALAWESKVEPGKHQVSVRLKYRNTANPVMVPEGGHEWVLNGTRTFEQQAGLGVRVVVKTEIDARAARMEQRLVLSLPATPVMLAKLDDGSIPAPPPPPKIEAPVDAGTPVVDAGVPPVKSKKKKLKR